MNLFVDTSVWSLALRRSPPSRVPEVELLERCLEGQDTVATTGLVIQELLQGFRGPMAHRRIIQDFSLLPLITPEVKDHIEAADLRNRCRRRGVQIGTIDALIARICIRYRLRLLTTDQDFEAMAQHCSLSLLKP